MTQSAQQALIGASFLSRTGAYAIVDGQFGSTGKGLVAATIARYLYDRIDYVTSNAGPNSGHTSYYGDEKMVLCQLPTAAAHLKAMGRPVGTFLNAGAVLDLNLMRQEIEETGLDVFVSRYAAVVQDENRLAESKDLIGRVGSTGKGTGAALADKVMRKGGAIFRDHYSSWASQRRLPRGSAVMGDLIPGAAGVNRGLVEVSQGHSLGINQGFYPYCTSRDCSVAQALNDAGIHPHFYQDCIAVFRTYPIRVAGDSGPGYDDQRETSWEEIGQEPEYTTVTKKKRRVFTWSNEQFRSAIERNRPGVIFLNFMNYLPEREQQDFVNNAANHYRQVMGRNPKAILLGYGPKVENVCTGRTSI